MKLWYEHQAGRCPKAGQCAGHRVRRTRRSLAMLNELRDAGGLAYLGPAPNRMWGRFRRPGWW